MRSRRLAVGSTVQIRWRPFGAIALLPILFLSACGTAASPTPVSPPFTSAEAVALECAGGQVVGGDIDRAVSTPVDPIAALQQEFEGVRTTDGFTLGLYEGRPAVVVTRDQRVVFIGSYGQDGRVYQYTGFVDAGIRLREA
jgi:hypothetical protein